VPKLIYCIKSLTYYLWFVYLAKPVSQLRNLQRLALHFALQKRKRARSADERTHPSVWPVEFSSMWDFGRF
jgi:hypothetical protein